MRGEINVKGADMELDYRYKRAKTSRITMLNIRKLYKKYTVANCHFTLSRASSFEKRCGLRGLQVDFSLPPEDQTTGTDLQTA